MLVCLITCNQGRNIMDNFEIMFLSLLLLQNVPRPKCYGENLHRL